MSCSSWYHVPPPMDHFDRNMEALKSASLGAMGSLIRKLDDLARTEDVVCQLRDDLGSISTKMAKLLEVDDPSLTVNYWMKDVRELSYDMEDCVDQFFHANDADDKLDWINDLLVFRTRVEEVRERYDIYKLEYGPTHPTTTIRHRFKTMYGEPGSVVPVGMESPTNELRRLVEPTIDDENDLQLKVVSILGVEGVGKSMLAQKLWRELGGQFECQAFVQAAKKPDMRMILRSILSQICLQQPPEACQVPNLIHDIGKHLQDKSYFIIIDDLWAVSIWDVLSRSFPEGDHCSRIITTTTIEDVALACCSYDPEHIFKMKPLGADHSYQVFINRVFGFGKGCPQKFNDLSDDITRKCGGLPLAIICISTLVASQLERVEQWEYVQNFLHHNLRTNSSVAEILKQVLKLCYNSLSRCLKTCLLYLSVYPENYLFLKDDLMKQWIAEDFICTTEGKNIVEVASSYFDELLSLGLIQRIDTNSNKKGLSYVVHPTVFDFITCKSMEDNFITIIDYSQSTAGLTEKIRRLSLHFGSATYATLPASVGLSEVRSLNFMGLLNCMPSLVEFRLVRIMILDLRSDDGDTMFSLAEICELFLLRYLQIRCNVTIQLPDQMQCLKHLETLEINARVSAIPSDIVHVPRLSNVCLGGKKNHKHLSLGFVASVKAFSLDDSNSASTPRLQVFELLPPICIFSRLPEWIPKLCRLYILEIVVRELWTKDISVLGELPALTSLCLYVRRPTAGRIVFSRGMFQTLEYFKFVCGVLLLDFLEEAMPNLQRLKLGFNVHRGEQYSDMLAGIQHLLNLQKIAARIGAAPDAEESDRRAAGSAFKDAIRTHPCHQSLKMKRVDRVDEEYDRSKKQSRSQQKEYSNEQGQVPKERHVMPTDGLSIERQPLFARNMVFACRTRSRETLPVDRPTFRLPETPQVERRTWKLVFRNPPQLPIFTGSKIEDVNGNPLEIILVDVDTGSPSAIPQALRIELVPLFGDFPPDDREDWAADEFPNGIVKQRQGKRPLLTGEVSLTMRDGRATVNELQFTDNSSWVRCREFRIGVRVVPGSYDGARILEAMTEAFVVKEHRGDLYRKHYPPVLGDSVWRLEKIGKEGAFHRKLRQHHVKTVQEFLRMLTIKPHELRAILGDGMTDRMWEATMNHARTCVPGDKVYAYRAAHGTIYVDSIFNLVKVEFGGVECPLDQLDKDQTSYVQQLILDAYEHRHSLQEADAACSTATPDTTNNFPLVHNAAQVALPEPADPTLWCQKNPELDSQATVNDQAPPPANFGYQWPGQTDSSA